MLTLANDIEDAASLLAGSPGKGKGDHVVQEHLLVDQSLIARFGSAFVVVRNVRVSLVGLGFFHGQLVEQALGDHDLLELLRLLALGLAVALGLGNARRLAALPLMLVLLVLFVLLSRLVLLVLLFLLLLLLHFGSHFGVAPRVVLGCTRKDFFHFVLGA